MIKKGKLTDFILKDVKQVEKQLAKEVAPEINKLFKESVYDSLIQWYSEYSPNIYQRTNNFMNVYKSANTLCRGNILTMRVDSSLMNDYLGFDIPPYPSYERQTLYANTATNRRPDFSKAAKYDVAYPLYEYALSVFRAQLGNIATGVFGEHMHIEMSNDGPVMIIVEKNNDNKAD